MSANKHWWVVLRTREGEQPLAVSVPRREKIDAERDRDTLMKIFKNRRNYRVRRVMLVAANG